MAELPKIVHQRLLPVTTEQVALAQAHPEADVLTAFAEQALPALERDDVLRHLALCGDCRDVVALALPADVAAIRGTEVPAQEEAQSREVIAVAAGRAGAQRKRRFAWAGFGWANLRWATLAAGIALAVFVMRPALERTSKIHTAPSLATGKSTAQLQPEVMPVMPQIVSGAVPDDSVAKKRALAGPLKTEVSKLDASKNGPTLNKLPTSSGTPMALVSPADQLRADHPNADQPKADRRTEDQSKMSLASSRTAADFKSSRGADAGGASKDSMPRVPAAGTAFDLRAQTPASAPPSEEGKSSQVAVEAGSEATTVSTVNSNEIAQAKSPALQTTPDITKAKPALDSSTVSNPQGVEQNAVAQNANVAVTSASSPLIAKRATSWMIAGGMLKRSLDGGQTWLPATPADHPVLCYGVRGGEVLAGGQSGTLLRSTDNGATWVPIAVSFQGQPLTSAVVHIEMPSPAQIFLSTDNHETWSSADRGRTWQKK
ncbi:MAG: hypothetical protein WCB53_22505 [Terriglobales bacterium]